MSMVGRVAALVLLGIGLRLVVVHDGTAATVTGAVLLALSATVAALTYIGHRRSRVPKGPK